MNEEFLKVGFVDVNRRKDDDSWIARYLSASQVPRPGDSFVLYPDEAPVKVISRQDFPNAEFGFSWLVIYQRPS